MHRRGAKSWPDNDAGNGRDLAKSMARIHGGITIECIRGYSAKALRIKRLASPDWRRARRSPMEKWNLRPTRSFLFVSMLVALSLTPAIDPDGNGALGAPPTFTVPDWRFAKLQFRDWRPADWYPGRLHRSARPYGLSRRHGQRQTAQQRRRVHAVGRSWHRSGQSWHQRGRSWAPQGGGARQPQRGRHFRGRSWHARGRSWHVRGRSW